MIAECLKDTPKTDPDYTSMLDDLVAATHRMGVLLRQLRRRTHSPLKSSSTVSHRLSLQAAQLLRASTRGKMALTVTIETRFLPPGAPSGAHLHQIVMNLGLNGLAAMSLVERSLSDLKTVVS